MDLKFYLNKLVKVDGIENYTLKTLQEIIKRYEKFLKDSDGYDPDFPMTTFGGDKKGGGNKIEVQGRNVYENYNPDNPDPDFRGIKDRSELTKQMFENGNKTGRTR